MQVISLPRAAFGSSGILVLAFLIEIFVSAYGSNDFHAVIGEELGLYGVCRSFGCIGAWYGQALRLLAMPDLIRQAHCCRLYLYVYHQAFTSIDCVLGLLLC